MLRADEQQGQLNEGGPASPYGTVRCRTAAMPPESPCAKNGRFLGVRRNGQVDWTACKAVAGRVERMNRLYEQGADSLRIGQYVRRRQQWASGDDSTAA